MRFLAELKQSHQYVFKQMGLSPMPSSIAHLKKRNILADHAGGGVTPPKH